MTWGGARPGAGRKSRREKHAAVIEAAEDQIAGRMTEIIAAQFELALGVTVQETDPATGGVTVYTEPPNAKAGQYLIDRILGKPVQHVQDEDAEDKLTVYGQLIHELRSSRGLEDDSGQQQEE
jgi:hypothetical protein